MRAEDLYNHSEFYYDSVKAYLFNSFWKTIKYWLIGGVVALFIMAIFFNPNDDRAIKIYALIPRKMLNEKTGLYEWINYTIIGYGYLFLFWILFGISAIGWTYYKLSFICHHCLHSIIFHKINNFTCPFCKTTNHKNLEIFWHCSSCSSTFDQIQCPHCKNSIKIHSKYNHLLLEAKRK